MAVASAAMMVLRLSLLLLLPPTMHASMVPTNFLHRPNIQHRVPCATRLCAVGDINAMSYRELQAACKAQGLGAKGKTDELRERLLAAVSDAPAAAPASVPPVAAEGDGLDDLLESLIEDGLLHAPERQKITASYLIWEDLDYLPSGRISLNLNL